MAKFYDTIEPKIKAFIDAQHIFFVATAPRDGGRVNLSPKGLDCFRVLGPNRVAYLDMTGSGNETAAHLLENGRITFMFCSFETAPRILRLFGTGRPVLPGDAEWAALSAPFTLTTGTRQIIAAEIDRVQTSCGYGVPFFDYRGERGALARWAEQEGEEALAAYRVQHNARSQDGLPTRFAAD